jgi:hypothetical protein
MDVAFIGPFLIRPFRRYKATMLIVTGFFVSDNAAGRPAP